MSGAAWVLTTSGAGVSARVAAVRPLGTVTVVALGPRAVAEQAAAAGPDRVLWCVPTAGVPVEAYASAVAELVAQAAPRLVASGTAPDERALLGAAATALGAALLPGVRVVTATGDRLVVERSAVGGAVVQTIETTRPLAVTIDADDDTPAADTAPIEAVSLEAAPGMRTARRASAAPATGLAEATRVVAVGRGLRARADLDLVTDLAAAVDAELACSMPVADDLGWLDKSRYVGRSGQTLSPRLYLAVGISGAPQHLEGIRGAKVVAAIDIDPNAQIFRRASYGIAGDLYEVVPALVRALAN
jgi:electron transfer flavoprotein alpha subunit